MNEQLRNIGGISLVRSIKSVISQGNIKHYAIKIESYNSRLHKKLESLWPFGIVELSDGILKAEYIVKPNEIDEFNIKLSKLDDLNNAKLREVVVGF